MIQEMIQALAQFGMLPGGSVSRVAFSKEASARLAPYVKRTPVLRAEKLDSALGCSVYFKPECLQLTGSFKIRGATNKILTMTDEERAKGIIASSSGNHAQGVAFAAGMLGCKATIVLPDRKVEVSGGKHLFEVTFNK